MPLDARRPDIQSLRALAIALVVAAHAHVAWLQGGYVGVDVFFVLSGYLISGLVLRDVEATGHFDPWRFYARRIKRLLPALILVLLVVAVAGWFFVSPWRQGDDAGAAESAVLWLSNFYFAAHLINYFSTSLDSNLFLHTWSLAVEEQFYLVWPWLLIYMYGVWKWQGAPMSNKRLAVGLGVVAIVSLVLAEFWAHTGVELGFYLMPARAWEFALGALVFLLRRSMDAGSFARLDRWRGRSLLNVAGWLAVLLASVVYGVNLRYPGLWAVLPCLGAALVLLDAPEKKSGALFSRVFMREPVLQFIGDISYSLYLWHWPVLILGREVLGYGAGTEAFLVALSVALASAGYYAVERPIHRARMSSPVKIFVPATLGMVLCFFAMVGWQNEAKNLAANPTQAKFVLSRWNLPAIYNDNCDTWFHSDKVTACVYSRPNAQHTVVMFGDSVLAQWFPAVAEVYLHNAAWRLIVLTKSSCPVSEVSFYYDKIHENYTVCDVWRQRVLNYIVRLHPDVIIMGSSRFYPFSDAQWIRGTRTVLDRLSPVARSVVMVSPTPVLGFDGIECIATHDRWPTWLRKLHPCETKIGPPSARGIVAILKRSAKQFPNVHVVDMRGAICPGDVCRARRGSMIVYRDSIHLTALFVQSLAAPLQQVLRNVGALQ